MQKIILSESRISKFKGVFKGSNIKVIRELNEQKNLCL